MNIHRIKLIALSIVVLSFTSCKESKSSEVSTSGTSVAKVSPTKQEAATSKMKQAVAKQEAAVKQKVVTKKEVQKTVSTAKSVSNKTKKQTNVQSADVKTVKQAEKPVVKKQVITGPAVETVSPEVFKKMVEGGNVQLLDIRTKREFVANRIKGAINFDVYKRSFISDVEAGGVKKDEPIYIYCLTGSRSRSAKNMLAKAGYKKVYELQGGIKHWYQKGFKIEK